MKNFSMTSGIARRRIPALTATLGLGFGGPASAQAWPARPVQWIVPFPPGGVTDILARITGQWLAARLGQPVIIENRPGAGGRVGTEAVVRAAPDGHTLLLAGAFNTINTAIFGNIGFDFAQDLAPVAGLMRTFYVVVIHPSLPVRSLAELIAYARANPGRLNMASGGNGSPHQIAGEQFKMMTGIDLTHVPYRGSGPALNDMVAGHAQVMFDNLTSALPFIRDGKLRALAVSSPARSPLLPDLPSAAETVPGYEPAGWVGVCAPKSTPPEIISRLNALINAALQDAAFAARLTELGGTAMMVTPAELGRVIAADTERYRQIVAFAAIRPD